MKSIRGFALGLALGLAGALSTVGIAQNPKPADQNKAESCCAMGSGCCTGDSCSMKDHGKDHAKMHSSKDGCCCCSDSCDAKMKEKNKQG